MNDVNVSRLIPAPPEAVFRFWTDPDHVLKWWGPSGVVCSEVEIDLSPGGSYRIANRLPDGRILWIHGTFEEIDPPKLLRYTWGVGLDCEATERVTVTFSEASGGTIVSILHENAPDAPTAESHVYGWRGCLDGLERYSGGSSS